MRLHTQALSFHFPQNLFGPQCLNRICPGRFPYFITHCHKRDRQQTYQAQNKDHRADRNPVCKTLQPFIRDKPGEGTATRLQSKIFKNTEANKAIT